MKIPREYKTVDLFIFADPVADAYRRCIEVLETSDDSLEQLEAVNSARIELKYAFDLPPTAGEEGNIVESVGLSKNLHYFLERIVIKDTPKLREKLLRLAYLEKEQPSLEL
tara:strand:- start:6406 stop:6738 length:333 start_codon:yes stop_codon:yes gene_type:complete